MADHPSPADMRFHLQNLLDNKEKQLQQAGTLGQRVLAQQMELEERIRQLQEIEADKGESDEIDSELQERYRELAETINTWDDENVQLSSAFSSKKLVNGDHPSPTLLPADLPNERERSATSGPSAAQSSRRAKNAAHRANDVEFAFEIGSGLITEVRRLQSLLGERDKAIQDMKEEKDDLEKTLEGLRTALRTQEQSADKFKEENWNLEVTLQELRTQLTDVQGTAQRSEAEQKRLTKVLTNTREAADQHKNEAEKFQNTIEEMKAKHETDIAQARKFAAGLQRDKSDLQQALDTAKADAAKANRRLPRFGSPLTPNGSDSLTPAYGGDDEEDVFSVGGASTNRRKLDGSAMYAGDGFGSDYPDSSPDPSPSRPTSFLSPNHPANEMEALQQRLAHAQRQINTLKSTLQREKELRMEYRRKLGDTSFDGLGDEEEEITEEPTSIKSRTTTPFRGRGRGRGRLGSSGKGPTLAQRLSMVSRSPSVEYQEEDVEHGNVPETPPRQDYEDDEEEEDGEEQQSTIMPPSNRTSVDGMDPAFANVLRGSPHTGSPLRQSVTARAPRRSRGGAAYQGPPRPPSLVVSSGSALDAELGLASVAEDMDLQETQISTAEFGCQTEDMEILPPTPPIRVTPAKADASVQGAPALEEAESVLKPVRVESGMLTEPQHTSEAEVQTPRPHTIDIDTQTGEVPVITGFDTTPRRTTLTQADLSRSSGETTVSGAPVRLFLAEDDGEETETGEDTETDTDMDEYQDAQQSVVATTPSQSVNDFHSITTVSDNDFSESDDDSESIKASNYSRRKRSIGSSLSGPGQPQAGPSVSYSTKAVEVVFAEPPKPEVKEISIQTDDWVPPQPLPAVIPARTASLSPGFELYTGGPTAQQFQFISPPPSAGPTTTSIPLPSPSLRDSVATVIPGMRFPTSSMGSDKRLSAEVPVSETEENAGRLRTPSIALDKSRPPTMMLPPPPRLPPPPNSMPPPTFIPERKARTSTSSSHDIPPPRPSSPPPPELIHRATTPTFSSGLSVPRGRGAATRQHGSSMPPQSLRQLPSTSSFRSAANAATYGPFSVTSARSSLDSRRSSVSSHERGLARALDVPREPVTPHKADLSQASTDPAIIHSITQTMIGEFLYKYTRKTIGKGYGTARHKRFFWVHPYTKTLYWSSADPGSSNVSESSAKSAYIEGVRSVVDPNPMPPGLYQYSVIISTPQREMKISAPTKERHDIWLNALKYLLARPNPTPISSPGNMGAGPISPLHASAPLPTEFGNNWKAVTSSPQSQRSARSAQTGLSGDSWNITPRGQRSQSQLSIGGSVSKRSGTPALEYLRWAGSDDPQSPGKSIGQGFEHISAQDEEDLDFELHGHSLDDEGFEGLENVRACCDGRHTVGPSGRDHHHHHHHHHNGEPQMSTDARPVSPAWSFRSRAGSSHSHDGNSIFSWGRGEDGKRKFGSRRSTKTTPDA